MICAHVRPGARARAIVGRIASVQPLEMQASRGRTFPIRADLIGWLAARIDGTPRSHPLRVAVDGLAGCLLLPRPLLLRAASQRMTAAEVATRYHTSEAMARFRLNASGVLVQIGRAQAARQHRSQPTR